MNTDYLIRARSVGSTHRVKVWLASAAEPSAWQIDVVDAAHTAGLVNVGNNGGSAAGAKSIQFDQLTISAAA